MKRKLQQIAAVFLAAFLLFSTISLSVDLHFCGDHLVDLSFTGRAANCNAVLNAAANSGKCPMAAMECCSDEAISLQGQDDLQQHIFDYSLSHPDYLAHAIIYNFYQVGSPILKESPTSFVDSSPPPLIRKIHLLHSTFLI